MATKVGINGFGRIGRQVLKAITERYPGKLEVVAINDLVPTDVNANLLKYDSNYGRWEKDIRSENDALVVDGRADRKSTRLNSSHGYISYAVFCLKQKNNRQ